MLDFGSSAGSSGTVTSVALSLPAMFTVTGSPVTTTGTLAATLATQAANLVFGGPATGADAAPTFRSLVLADLPSGVGLTASPLSQFAATTSAQLASVISNETGTGVLVFNDTPTLIAPLLGTPTSGVLTNCTGLPLASITGLGANVATWLATPSSANLLAAVTDETGTGALVFANTPTLVTPLLGTPTSGTLTNCTGLPISTGVSGLAANVATFLATPSSANLLAALTDKTGTGVNVFATSPTLVTPVLGVFTGTSGVLTEAVGTSCLVLTGATQTSSFPVLSMTQTWNASGTTFKGVVTNITNTASASGSLIHDWQIGGTSLCAVNKDGSIYATKTTGGSATAVSFGIAAGRGVFSSGSSRVDLAANSNGMVTVDGSALTFVIPANTSYGWSASNATSSAPGASPDTTLYRDAAGVLAQRVATTAQKFRLYNTFTTLDTAGEWFKLDWKTTANQFRFGAVNGSSTGTARVATWDYGGVEATPTAAISVPATSGALTFGGGIILPEAGNIQLGTVTGTKIGTATTQLLSFYNATPVAQQARGATLTNNVTAGGTDDTIANYTDLTLYANDAAAIRNNIYQLARIVRMHDVALRALGLEN